MQSEDYLNKQKIIVGTDVQSLSSMDNDLRPTFMW